MSKRPRRSDQTCDVKSIELKINRGYSFYYINFQNATIPILAKNICQAFGVLRIWLELPSGYDLGFENGSCSVVEISQIVPHNFLIFNGRRQGLPRALMLYK